MNRAHFLRCLLERSALVLLPVGLAAFTSCDGGGGPLGGSGATPGSFLAHTDPALSAQSRQFVVDANSGGRATSVRIREIRWGRLAVVRDLAGVLQQTDYLIGEDIHTDNIHYRFEINPVTEQATVTILHAFGTPAYDTYFTRLSQNLIRVDPTSLAADELGPFPLIPRNAAIMVSFDDLIDSATINAQTLKVQVGYPPNTPFDARIIPDINHGDLADFDGMPGAEFHTTRVIIDTTVSSVEASATNPPLPVNSLGFPASLTQSQANVAVRIPTRLDPTVGQLALLRNPTAHALAFTGNGPTDTTVTTRDVVRAMRSGGSPQTTGDLNNGFLIDNFRPSVLGTQAVFVSSVVPVSSGISRCTINFNTLACASALQVGDVIQQTGVFAEVVCAPGSNCAGGVATESPTGSVVTNVHVRVVFPAGGTLSGNGTISQVAMRYDPTIHFGKSACFVRFPSIGQAPDTRVQPDSPVIVRFSEPMDPAKLKPFDTFSILRVSTAPSASDYIVGEISGSTDLREFTFVPRLPLRHVALAAETYYVKLLGGTAGPTDLAGNALTQTLPQVPFTLDPVALARSNGGFALRFSSLDEIGGNGLQELRGQVQFDFDQGEIRPRPVAHYPGIADRTQSVPSIMQPFAQGVQTPLSGLGSKLQTLWRYCDTGFSIFEEQDTNIDVEGIAWAPAGGVVVVDNYDRFEIRLSHCKYLPDETVDINLLPIYPNSGVVQTYSSNLLDNSPLGDPQKTVHPGLHGVAGYNVVPGDLFQADTGTFMMPYPFNRGIPVHDYTYWTYRDTTVQTRGGVTGTPGAELPIVNQVNQTTNSIVYAANNIPTIALPILMEFACYPDTSALGLNSFDISLATASSPRPNFRAFSTGGYNTSGLPIIKNPDAPEQSLASGGFNPNSIPTPGAVTLWGDNSFYIGQLDLVTRISRAYTIWFDTNGTSSLLYSPPVVEPRPSDQPQGTSVDFAYRGATVVPATPGIGLDATLLNMYGDPRPPIVTPPQTTGGAAPTFLGADSRWKTALSEVNGAKYFQVRISFLSNAETGLSPAISALGFAFRF